MHSAIIVTESDDFLKIKKCIESVVDFGEVILVDTKNAIKQVNIENKKILIKAGGKPIKLFKSTNTSLADAFNMGSDLIDENAETVSFTRSNIVFDKEYIPTAKEMLKKYKECCAVYSDCYRQVNGHKWKVFHHSFSLEALMNGSFTNVNPIYSVSTVRENLFDTNVLTLETWDFLLSISKNKLILHAPEKLYTELETIKDILLRDDHEKMKNYILKKRA